MFLTVPRPVQHTQIKCNHRKINCSVQQFYFQCVGILVNDHGRLEKHVPNVICPAPNIFHSDSANS